MEKKTDMSVDKQDIDTSAKHSSTRAHRVRIFRGDDFWEPHTFKRGYNCGTFEFRVKEILEEQEYQRSRRQPTQLRAVP